jgi:hypothetical protein
MTHGKRLPLILADLARMQAARAATYGVGNMQAPVVSWTWSKEARRVAFHVAARTSREASIYVC